MMVSNTAIQAGRPGAWDMIVRCCDADGSAAHPHLRRLLAAAPDQRDLSDAVHALCSVHGDHPGMVAAACARAVQAGARSWLKTATAGFAEERAYLARLTAAVGPLPSTPGQSESEAALAGARHALEMLGRSDRSGCATGAVAALLMDWTAIRHVLDVAAHRFGVVAPASLLPDEPATAAMIAAVAPPPERALLFGAQQLFAQHRGLWTLLEARASARGDL